MSSKPHFFCLLSEKVPGENLFWGRETKQKKLIEQYVMLNIMFYLEDDEHKQVDFKSETLTFAFKHIQNASPTDETNQINCNDFRKFKTVPSCVDVRQYALNNKRCWRHNFHGSKNYLSTYQLLIVKRIFVWLFVITQLQRKS